jgi:hypothetical protein
MYITFLINEKNFFNWEEYNYSLLQDINKKTVTHLFTNTNTNRAESLVIKYDTLENQTVIKEIILRNISDISNDQSSEKKYTVTNLKLEVLGDLTGQYVHG